MINSQNIQKLLYIITDNLCEICRLSQIEKKYLKMYCQN